MKIVKWFLIGIALLFLLPILGFWIHGTFFYEYEMNQIKSDLNKIEGVSVIDIWGHKDITLEEVGARVKIKGKGEIELIDLSSDANNYPNRVIISKIGGYSFRTFSCFDYEDKGFHKGLGYSINISENSEIGKQIGIEFTDELKVVYEVPVGQDASRIKADFDNNLGTIKKYLEFLAKDINDFNGKLEPSIKARLERRKDKLDNDDEIANTFGFPIK
ncbi:hypothetical protein [Altibacter lentus]|uniref:hypothetical protein n=1 Tax=Altibacter lentus TaxID=1223410 RepID=UPI0005590F82|nr:hypothetical protein [Altibacter lentus]